MFFCCCFFLLMLQEQKQIHIVSCSFSILLSKVCFLGLLLSSVTLSYSLSLSLLFACCSFVAPPSFSALMFTYLWMVSSAWFAWSKCPPLHPYCHRGNRTGQNNPESNSPLFIFRSCQLCCPVFS